MGRDWTNCNGPKWSKIVLKRVIWSKNGPKMGGMVIKWAEMAENGPKMVLKWVERS